MKCPKCGFVSFEHLNRCRKCGVDLATYKVKMGIDFPQCGKLGLVSGRVLAVQDEPDGAGITAAVLNEREPELESLPEMEIVDNPPSYKEGVEGLSDGSREPSEEEKAASDIDSPLEGLELELEAFTPPSREPDKGPAVVSEAEPNTDDERDASQQQIPDGGIAFDETLFGDEGKGPKGEENEPAGDAPPPEKPIVNSGGTATDIGDLDELSLEMEPEEEESIEEEVERVMTHPVKNLTQSEDESDTQSDEVISTEKLVETATHAAAALNETAEPDMEVTVDDVPDGEEAVEIEFGEGELEVVSKTSTKSTSGTESDRAKKPDSGRAVPETNTIDLDNLNLSLDDDDPEREDAHSLEDMDIDIDDDASGNRDKGGNG